MTTAPALMLNPLAAPRPAEQRRLMSERQSAAEETLDAVSELVGQARRGDREAFGELVQIFERRIFNYLCQFTSNTHDAEDLTQDTFVKAWRSIARFESTGSFSSWLYTIAKRTALNHLRSRKHESGAEAPEEIDATTPAHICESGEERDSIWSLARKLKPTQYEALWLRYGEDFSIEETARIMRTNQIRVRVLLHRGRAQLACLLEQRALREPHST